MLIPLQHASKSTNKQCNGLNEKAESRITCLLNEDTTQSTTTFLKEGYELLCYSIV